MANGYFSFQRSPLPPPAPGSLFLLCLTSSADSTKLWFNLHRSTENAIGVQIMLDVHVLSAVSLSLGPAFLLASVVRSWLLTFRSRRFLPQALSLAPRQQKAKTSPRRQGER